MQTEFIEMVATQVEKIMKAEIFYRKIFCCFATSAELIHKFKQLALVTSQQSYMHKNYYRHFIKIYETNIHKNTAERDC